MAENKVIGKHGDAINVEEGAFLAIGLSWKTSPNKTENYVHEFGQDMVMEIDKLKKGHPPTTVMPEWE